MARTGTNIPPDRMYLMKASVKTNGLNAYVSGIGATKRIVVWDTTAGRMPDDEVLFIFGHESGHYVLHHIPKEFAGYCGRPVLCVLGVRGVCGVAGEALRSAMGRAGSRVAHGLRRAAVRDFDCRLPTEPAGNAFSRHFEHQADVYGQEAIHGIVADPQKTAVAAFNELGEAWLEDPNPNPFIEFWLYDHPSIATPRRICRALRSVGERRAWGVLQELGVRGQGSGVRDSAAIGRSAKPLEDAGSAHAAADAHGHHAVPRAPRFHLSEKSCG